MSVVLRCSTCGTTQAHGGECEACSEGEVQYFCTNHEQGVWLDGPACSRCGAKFGDPPRKAPTPRTPSAAALPAGAPDFRPPGRRRAPERPAEPDFGRRPRRRPEPEEPAEPEVMPRTPSLEDLLAEITARGRRRAEAEEVSGAEPPARRPGFPLAGCLVRVVGMAFLLIAAAIIFLFVFFGSLMMD